MVPALKMGYNVFGYGSLPGSRRPLVRVHKRTLNELTFERALCRQ